MLGRCFFISDLTLVDIAVAVDLALAVKGVDESE